MLFHKESKSERLNRLKLRLALCEINERHMKSVNKYYREHGTVQGHPNVESGAAAIIDAGIEKGEFPDNLPFSDHDVLHEYYEIQRLKQEIEKLESN